MDPGPAEPLILMRSKSFARFVAAVIVATAIAAALAGAAAVSGYAREH